MKNRRSRTGFNADPGPADECSGILVKWRYGGLFQAAAPLWDYFIGIALSAVSNSTVLSIVAA
jgi:hypothetical protein